MKRLILLSALACWFLSLGCLPSPPLQAKPPAGGPDPLQVTIEPKQDHPRVGEPFDVVLRVENTSEFTQTFEVMSCSWYDHWKASYPAITWEAWDCTRNGPVSMTLDPGEAYEKQLTMMVRGRKPPPELVFRMGFTPLGSNKTYWSEDVSLWPSR